MFDGPGKNIGNGLNAAMWVPGKSREVVLWNVIAKVVEQEERIEVVGVAETKGAAQMHSRSLERGLGFDETFNGSNGHADLPVSPFCQRAVG